MFERIKNRFTKNAKKKSVGKLKDDERIWQSLRTAMQDSNTVGAPYKNSVWTYSAVDTISRNLSRAPFKFYKNSKESDAPLQRDEITKGKLFELFRNPNPLMTTKALFTATSISLELTGEAFWILERDNISQLPKEIWTFNSDRFTPILDERLGVLTGWLYKNGEQKVTLSTHEVLFFRYHNPYDDIRGMAPLEAAQLSIDQDYFASTYNKNFFKNGATVGGAIEIEDELSDEVYNRIINQFEDRHQGHSNAHKIALLEGGAKFKELGANNKDIDFANLKKLSREEILAAYKVNPVILGLYEDVKSHEGVRAAHKAFWLECLIPRMSFIQEIINNRFISKLGKEGANIIAEFDLNVIEALREDYYKKVDAASILQQMGYPINMINKRLNLGMNDVEWGDDFFLEDSKVQAVNIPYVPKPLEPVQPKESKVKPKEEPKDDSGSKSTELQDRYLTSRGLSEQKFLSKFKRFFFEQRKEIVSILHNSASEGIEQKDVPTILSTVFSDASYKKFNTLLKGAYSFSVKMGAEDVSNEIGIKDYKHNEKNFSSEIEQRLESLCAITMSLVEDELCTLFKEELSKGVSIYDIIALVKSMYNNIDKKVRDIARIEASGSVNLGRITLMSNKGFVAHKWKSFDKNCHEDLDGKSTLLGCGRFGKEDIIKYPNDLHTQSKDCTCVTVPVKLKTKSKGD